MATITRYVDPDAAVGGDGTTNGLTGSTCAYKSLNIWESSEQQDLTDSGGDIAECIVDSNDASHTADSTLCTIAGWTTSATCYIDIHTPTDSRAFLKWDDDLYRMDCSASANLDRALYINAEFVNVTGVQIKIFSNGHGGIVALEISLSTTVTSLTIHDCICYAKVTGGDTCSAIKAREGWSGKVCNLINNLCLLDVASGASWGGTGIHVNNSSAYHTVYCYNNTIIYTDASIGSGIGQGGNIVVTAKNNISQDGNPDYSGTFTSSSHNLSKDGTAPGTSAQTNKTLTFAGSGDYHLDSGDSDARGNGTDLSGIFTTDADGETRSAWDIGADEYSSGATAYEHSVAGGITPSGTISKESARAFAGGFTPSGSLIKDLGISKTGGITPAGAIVKEITQSQAGSITPTGATAKGTAKSYLGGITPTGATAKGTAKSYLGGITPTGATAKGTAKSYLGGIAPSGSLSSIRARLISLVGALTPSGALVASRARFVAIIGAIAPSGVLGHAVAKYYAGSISAAGTITRAISHTLSGGIMPSGIVSNIRGRFIAIAGALGLSGTITKRAGKEASGTLVASGSITKKIARLWGGILDLVGALTNTPEYSSSRKLDVSLSDAAVTLLAASEALVSKVSVSDAVV